MVRQVLILLALFVCNIYAGILPGQVLQGQCKRNDPNLNGCLLRRTAELLPVFCNGIPSAGIPSMDPLHIQSFHFQDNSGNVNVKAQTANMYLVGHRNARFTKAQFNPNTLVGEVSFEMPKFEFQAEIMAEGTVLGFPFKTHADNYFRYTGTKMHINFKLKSVMHNGREYYQTEFFELKSTSDTGHMQLRSKNPLNQITDDLTSAAFNSNSKVAMQGLEQFNNKAATALYRNVVDYILTKIPADELLPSQ